MRFYDKQTIIAFNGSVEMEKKFRIPTEDYRILEAIAKKRGITVEEAVELLITEFYEELKAKQEGKIPMFLYDYGEKGFVISMPKDLPKIDPNHEKSKVIRIEMPKDAKYPEPIN